MDVATIGFEADTSGLERANKVLGETAAKASAAEKAAQRWGSVAVISGGQIGKAFGGALSAIGPLAAAVDALTAAFSALGVVLAGPLLVAVGAIVATLVVLSGSLTLFINNSIEADAISAQLAATLEATGGVSGQTAESIDEHAQALQKLTTFEDDAIKAAATVLLTFTRIKGETFPAATEATLDLAQAMGGDLKGAAFTIGKALDNPLRGMLLLRRAGIDLGGSQQELIKNFMAAGKTAEAQGVILEAIKGRYGGAAEAARDTLGGALKALQHTFGNLFELASEKTDGLRGAINLLNETLKDPAVQAFIGFIGTLLVNALGLVVHTIARVLQACALLMQVFTDIAGWLGGKLISAGEAFIDWYNEKMGSNLGERAKEAFNSIIGAAVVVYEELKFLFQNFPDVIQVALVATINLMIAGFNKFIAFFTEKIDWLAEKANAGAEAIGMKARVGKFGKTEPIAPLPNPSLDKLTQGGDAFSLSPLDAKIANQRGAMNKDYFKEWFQNKPTESVKKAAAAVRDLGDDFANTGDKSKDAFQKIVEGAEAAIDKLKTETQAVGQTVAETARLKTEQELMAKAKEADITLTQEQIDKLKELARVTGEVTNANEAAKGTFKELQGAKEFIAQQELAQKQIGMTAEAAARLKYETELLNKASQNGAVILQQDQITSLKEAAAQMAATEQATKDMNEALTFTKDIFSNLFSDLKDALLSGKNMWESFGAAALGVLSKIADKLLNMALDGLLSSFLSPSAGSSSGVASSGSSAMGGMKSFTGGLTNMFDKIGNSFSGMWDQTKNFFGWGGDSMANAGLPGSAYFGPAAPGAGSWFGSLGMGNFLGAAGGIASAVSGFMKGGTAGTIGGIGGLIGAGVSLIPGIGQIAGPIISMLSAIVPGLFGEQKPTITNQEYGQLQYGSKGFFTNGGAWGPDANAKNLEGPLGQMGATMDSIFKVFGGVQDAGKVWGVALQSFSQQYGNGSSFSNQTSFLVDPRGGKRQWGMGSNAHDIGMETAGVQATINSILEGAVGQISDNMRQVLNKVNSDGEGSFQGLAEAVADIMTFDTAIKNFNTTTTAASEQIKEVDASFQALYDIASKYGLAASEVAKIDAERNRLRLKATEDFTYGISQGLLGFSDPLQAALNDLDKAKKSDLANNADYLRLVAGYNDQAANIEKYYYLQRNELIKKANEQALSAQKSVLAALQDYIKQILPGGALAGEGVNDKFAALKATYAASFAQASASPMDSEKVAAFMQAGQQLLEFEKSYFAADSRYQDARAQALLDAQMIQEAVANGLASSAIPNSDGSTDTDVQELINTVASLNEQINALLASQATLNAKLSRTLANG